MSLVEASVTMLRDSGVIVSAVSFKDNRYDGDTLKPALESANAVQSPETPAPTSATRS